MLTREEVIEMLKEVYNNDISDFNIDKLSIDELKDLVIEGCKPKSRIPVYDYRKIQIPEDTEFTETHKGPTPSGGAYSTAYFYDEDGCPCKREEASFMNIVEYSVDGTRINEHYGMAGKVYRKDS
ncbi:MAG: hypothetical protein IKH01_05290 [Prevotella sp.]|nr:hypothetical protein [Prevotella sp.]